jgi:hypothetical protein
MTHTKSKHTLQKRQEQDKYLKGGASDRNRTDGLKSHNLAL